MTEQTAQQSAQRTQYMLTMYQPDGEPPPSIDMAAVMREIGAWRDDLAAVGSWVFTGVLHPASTSTVVRMGDADVLTTDGPYVEGKEHVGGFTIIAVSDLDEALAWAARLTRITGLPTEVRPLRHAGR